MVSLVLALVELPSPIHVFAWIGQLAAALTAIGVIYKFLVKPFFSALKKVSEMYEKVEKMTAQFERNGGSSMRDSVDRIERSITQLDSRQRILLSLVPYAVVETDANGKVIFTNRIYQVWVGRPEDEVLGDGWVNCIHPSDRERVKHEWSEAVQESRTYESRFMMIDSHGRGFWAFTRAYPMVGDGHEGESILYGWFAVIYKCDNDICIKNPEACPFALTSGTCKGGDHSTLAPPIPRAEASKKLES